MGYERTPRNVGASDTINLKFTGLTQNLGQLDTALIGIFSQTAGLACEFWVNPVDFTLLCKITISVLSARIFSTRCIQHRSHSIDA